MFTKIAIIGTGNIGTWLFEVLQSQSNLSVLSISSRKIEMLPKDFDLYIFALKDDIYEFILQQIPFKMPHAVHTSGSLSQNILAPYAEKFGVLYPYQTIKKGERRKGEGRKFLLLSEEKVADGGSPPDDGRGDEGRGSLYKNPYIKMTETILQFYTDGRDKARLAPTLSDWSAALFWLANALLIPNAHYLLQNLHFDNLQGDANIVPYFKKWGLLFTETEHGIEVKHTHHVEIPAQKIDVAFMPDTAMILAVLSVCYPFELTLLGLKNINLKESNRLDILIDELSKFTTVEKDSEEVITIYKRTEKLPELFHFDSYNDHRFVMAWSLFKNFGTVNIENADCVKKSYPDFSNAYFST